MLLGIVIALVLGVGELGYINLRNGTTRPRRNVTIGDQSGACIELALWGNDAVKWAGKENDIIAMKNVLVNDYNGKSLTLVSSTGLHMNPKITEAQEIYNWIHHQGEISLTPLTKNFGDGNNMKNFGVATVEEMKVIMPQTISQGEFEVVGTLGKLKDDPVLWYRACPADRCMKKVEQQAPAGVWFCEKCNTTFETCDLRYVANILIRDMTGGIFATTFNEAGTSIFGMSAKELNDLKVNNEKQYIQTLFEISGKVFKFKIKARIETFNDESRIKFSVASAVPLNYVVESRKLLNLIGSYQNLELDNHVNGMHDSFDRTSMPPQDVSGHDGM